MSKLLKNTVVMTTKPAYSLKGLNLILMFEGFLTVIVDDCNQKQMSAEHSGVVQSQKTEWRRKSDFKILCRNQWPHSTIQFNDVGFLWPEDLWELLSALNLIG